MFETPYLNPYLNPNTSIISYYMYDARSIKMRDFFVSTGEATPQNASIRSKPTGRRLMTIREVNKCIPRSVPHACTCLCAQGAGLPRKTPPDNGNRAGRCFMPTHQGKRVSCIHFFKSFTKNRLLTYVHACAAPAPILSLLFIPPPCSFCWFLTGSFNQSPTTINQSINQPIRVWAAT